VVPRVPYIPRVTQLSTFASTYQPVRWIATAATAIALIVVMAACGGRPADEDSAGTFVSFNTVDADPDWSPDGRQIAFTSSRGDGGIYLVRPDGTGMRQVFHGESSDVDWSPDGKEIAFASSRGISILRVSDRTTRLVRRGSDFSLPAWAPNGRKLAVVRDDPGRFKTYDGWINSSSYAIYLVDVDGGDARRLLPRHKGSVGDARPGSIGALEETEPAWSPDGRHIAFQAVGVIVAADVGSGRRLTVNVDRAGYEPAWSPDGKLIAYQCEGQVCIANADGSGGERRVASDGGDPSWSPDSRRLVFEHYLFGGTVYGASPQSLSTVGANGTDLDTVTFGPSPAP
jgi:Tol biopolymer transport system component